MGDPKKQRRKYSTPKILWNKDRIEAEKEILKEYGLKNKKEIWIMEAVLKKYTYTAKKLIPEKSKQAELEKQHLMKKSVEYGLLQQTAKLEDVLGLKLNDILNRRLQTLVLKKGMARSAKQARQFITHEHLFVGDKKITSPSYIVKVSEEPQIHFDSASSLNSQDHPERVVIEKKKEAKPKKQKKFMRGRGGGDRKKGREGYKGKNQERGDKK